MTQNIDLVVLGLLASITPLGVLGVFAVTAGGKRSNGLAFVAGWMTVLGGLEVLGAFVLNGAVDDDPDKTPSQVLNFVLALFGLALIAWAFRVRATAGTKTGESAFEAKLRSLGAGGSYVAGIAMAPYPVGLGAGGLLVQHEASLGSRLVWLVVFLVLATWPMSVMVLVLYRGGPTMLARLERMHTWVEVNRSKIAFWLLLGVGLAILVPAMKVLLS